jgi:ribulose-phosphate 3-epimerase
MRYAHRNGVKTLTIEPMSCLAEPPTLPPEIIGMAEELLAYHREYPDDTAKVGYCADTSHGYMDEKRNLKHSNLDLLDAALPYITEIHLKNTDQIFDSTFGFTPEERERGIVNVEQIQNYFLDHASRLPVQDLIGYLEIGGPKVGRDYSDRNLEHLLRTSISYLREAFGTVDAGLSQVAQSPARNGDSASAFAATPAVRVSPSMMCADMTQLRDEVQRMESLGVEMLHWDIMDAHFVPNLPCGLMLLEQIRSITALPFDVHLMVENNDFFIAELGKIGVQMISVHHESALHCDRTLSLIRETGAAAGVALNPATPPTVLEYVTHLLDFLLVMTVNPGFAGQRLTGSGLTKIAACKAWLRSAGLNIPLEVDGNVSFDNIPKMVAAGADILVAGTSSLFSRAGSMEQNMGKILSARSLTV